MRPFTNKDIKIIKAELREIFSEVYDGICNRRLVLPTLTDIERSTAAGYIARNFPRIPENPLPQELDPLIQLAKQRIVEREQKLLEEKRNIGRYYRSKSPYSINETSWDAWYDCYDA